MADLDTDAAPRRRGRPKGTGIDDTALLRQILALMANDKKLKPTTAIKQAGIDNPSIVRRLREKLKDPTPAVKSVAAKPVAQTPRRRSATKRTTASKVQTRHPRPVPRSSLAAETADMRQPKSAAVEAPPTAPQPTTPTTSASNTSDSQKAREAALLAAYLKALQATAVPSLDDEQAAPTPRPVELPRGYQQTPPSPEASRPPTEPTPSAAPSPSWPSNPFAAFQQPTSSPMGMTLPFMPPFLQPFAPKPQPPNPATQSQMEALKLSVEVMTAVTKLQMFAFQNTLANTPFGSMLQAQTMMGQMLLASFAGMMGGGKKPNER